jgi:hypothetical protein
MPAYSRVFRDAWTGATAGTLPGLVDGLLVPVPKAAFDPPPGDAFTTPEETYATSTSIGRLFSDSQLPPDVRGITLGEPLPGGGHVLLAGPVGPDNPRAVVLTPLNDVGRGDLLARIPITPRAAGFEDGSHLYELHLADPDWGRIAAIELAGDRPVEEYAILIDNIPEVRIKVGTDPEGAPTAPLHLFIDDARAGEVDATESFRGVDLALTHASGGAAGQNSFALLGSGLDDRLRLAPGDHQGLAADGGPLDTTGKLAFVTADLGAGDDVFAGDGSQARTEITAGPDAGTFHENARIVELGFGDGPVFTRGFGTPPGATTAALLADWVQDAQAAGLADGFALTATIQAGTIVAESSTVATEADIATARFFTGNAAGAPRDPYPEPLLAPGFFGFFAGNGYNGLGVGNIPSGMNWVTRDIRNAEIGEYLIWTPETGLATAHDQLALRFGADAIAARVELSAFYSDERGPGEGEEVRIAIYRDGQHLLTRDFKADVPTGAAAELQSFSAPLSPGTGHVTLDGQALGIGRFDEIRIIGFQIDEASSNSNDMLLDGVRLVLPGEGYAVLGGDVLRPGAGPDRLVYRPGDGVDTIEQFGRGEDVLVLQGIARDQVTLETTGGGTALRFADAPDALVWLPETTGLTATAQGSDTIIA